MFWMDLVNPAVASDIVLKTLSACVVLVPKIALRFSRYCC